MLDVPAVHGGEPSESPASLGYHAPAAVDERAPAGRADLLALLRVGTAEAQDLVVGGLAGRQARERLTRHEGARLPLGGLAARGAELDTSVEPGADGLDEHGEEGPGQVAQHEEHRREEDGRPCLPSREVAEL